MDKKLKDLKGSSSRDNFKHWHKTLPRNWYACDLDLILVTKNKILAIIDFKKNSDKITWSEEQAYNNFLEKGFEIFIIKGNSPKDLKVFKYSNKDIVKLISTNYIQWERKLRNN